MRYFCGKFIVLQFLFICSPLSAGSEKEFQQQFCKGVQEFRLHDRTRVDCLTSTHAIEYDFGKKWHEAIGQSLGYSFETGKKAGIVLILKKRKHYKYWVKLNSVISHYALPIDTWVIKAYETPLASR